MCIQMNLALQRIRVAVVGAGALGITLLLAIPSTAQLPSSPASGGKIAFTSNRDGNYEIYVMNAEGSNQTRLTYNEPRVPYVQNPFDGEDMEPAWNPSGTEIAFHSH